MALRHSPARDLQNSPDMGWEIPMKQFLVAVAVAMLITSVAFAASPKEEASPWAKAITTGAVQAGAFRGDLGVDNPRNTFRWRDPAKREELAAVAGRTFEAGAGYTDAQIRALRDELKEKGVLPKANETTPAPGTTTTPKPGQDGTQPAPTAPPTPAPAPGAPATSNQSGGTVPDTGGTTAPAPPADTPPTTGSQPAATSQPPVPTEGNILGLDSPKVGLLLLLGIAIGLGAGISGKQVGWWGQDGPRTNHIRNL